MGAQVRIGFGARAPIGHLQQAQIASALPVGGEFPVELEDFVAQPLLGAAQFEAGALLVQGEQPGGDVERFGLDLGVPQQTARGLRQSLERS
ncbi:hypothetical protein [Streptomyces hirsutus]|uniref:hypothetical protein n=1 Tax=Streptomyces hirsutus TaxID=35620 RepID=UPI003F4D2BEE